MQVYGSSSLAQSKKTDQSLAAENVNLGGFYRKVDVDLSAAEQDFTKLGRATQGNEIVDAVAVTEAKDVTAAVDAEQSVAEGNESAAAVDAERSATEGNKVAAAAPAKHSVVKGNDAAATATSVLSLGDQSQVKPQSHTCVTILASARA